MAALAPDAIERRAPDDWPTAPERAYATAQERLAADVDVDAASLVVDSSTAGPIHVLAAGAPDGEPVVLTHGVATTAATWLPLFPALTDEYRLYALDRPGRGLSAAPSYRGRDLRAFLTDYLVEVCDALEIDRPHAIGNSLGGAQAFTLELEYDRVDRLCLVGAPAGVSTEMPLTYRLLTVRGLNRVLYWLARRGDPVENAREQLARVGVVDDSAIPASVYSVLAAGEELPGRTKSLRSLTSEQASFGRLHPVFDLRNELIRLDRPTAFVWGSEDSFYEPDVGRAVARRMPEATFWELPEHGHMPWLEPGEEVDRRVREFLAE